MGGRICIDVDRGRRAHAHRSAILGAVGLTLTAVILLASASPSPAQPARAITPLDTPFFSIDRESTSVSPNLRARDILDKPGPLVFISGAGLGLASPTLDELDDISVNRNVVPATQDFVILFSVDKASVGGAAPDPGLVDNNRPFNVRDQAVKKQAAGDIFMSTDAFNRADPGPLGDDTPVPHGSSNNNTLVKNQGDTGGVDLDLEKEIPPEVPADAIEPSDELDGISEKDDPGAPFAFGHPGTPALFYTLRNGSPSLVTLPGTPSGANVFVDLDPTMAGDETLYAGASALGLVAGASGDDIDGLIVFDNGNNIYNPQQDQIIFSLTRNSPFLIANQLSPADVLIRANGVTSRLAAAGQLGLLPTDNIDALEIKPTNNVNQTVFNTAIFSVIPGDFNGDGNITLLDCVNFRNCFSGAGVSYDTNGTANFSVSVGPGQTFSPPSLTIQTGDTVNWIWAGGLHNVVSGVDGVSDGAFNSGAPVGTTGFLFSVDFDVALMNLHPRHLGEYKYFSQPDLPNMTGIVRVVAPACATYDLDYDGDIDCEDWRAIRAYYAIAAPFPCVPLSVQDFINALLGAPGPAVNTCIADMNLDHVLNGRDIAPFVEFLVP